MGNSSLLDALDSSFPCYSLGQGSEPPAPEESSESEEKGALENPRKRSWNLIDFTGSSSSQQVPGQRTRIDTNAQLQAKPLRNHSGFHLNYDEESVPLPIDQGGPDQVERMAAFVTKSIDNLSHGLTVMAAMEKLGLKGQRDLLPGMEVRLLSHQAIGVAWMLEQEHSDYRGGILADDMGLGKTVQMIATMVSNPPGPQDSCKTTLIVVPAALLQQWKDEILSKTNGCFEVHIHHGKDKLKTKEELKSKDVIITSYQTLHGDFNIPKGVTLQDQAEWLALNGGLLSHVKFFRAIVDEAQFIRNRATMCSISIAHVRAKYRWLLTGTPVTNTLADIYGLLRFGKFRPWNDWDDFNRHVAKVQVYDAPLAGFRAQAILKPILLRRTKNSTIEGKPILQLPKKTVELVWLQFSDEEQYLYQTFQVNFQNKLNKFIKEGSVMKNYDFILVMILRLRQLCCHPQLILNLAEEFEDPTLLVGSELEKELGRAKKVMGIPWVEQVKRKFLIRAHSSSSFDFEDEQDTPTCPVCKDMFMNNTGRVLPCQHEICFDCALELTGSSINHDGIFGQGSEKENLAVEKAFEVAVAKGHRPCPTCKKMTDLSPGKIFMSGAFEPSDKDLRNFKRLQRQQRKLDRDARMRSPEEDEEETKEEEDEAKEFSFEQQDLDDSDDELPDVGAMFETRPVKRQKQETKHVVVKGEGSKPKKAKAKGRSTAPSMTKIDANSQSADSEGPSQAVLAAWSRGDDDLEPSTKMVEMLRLVQEWEACGDKVICYSQWTSMLDLIEILYSRHGIQTLRFDGKMDRRAREATLQTFKSPGGPRVILISTKSGSVGLNLVSANRVVNMDLSWNYASESQAYDRCHRIGQEKEVTVKRLVVKGTIEEQILRLQDVKLGLADAALGEGTGARLNKLSVKDIKLLFGMTPKKKVTPVQNDDQANSSD